MGLANWLLPACSPHICREKWLVKGDCGRNMGRIDGSFTRNWNVTLARFTRADQWECRLLLGVVPNAGLEHVDSTRGELLFFCCLLKIRLWTITLTNTMNIIFWNCRCCTTWTNCLRRNKWCHYFKTHELHIFHVETSRYFNSIFFVCSIESNIVENKCYINCYFLYLFRLRGILLEYSRIVLKQIIMMHILLIE